MQSSKVHIHYGEVDGYRGIAALLIVLLHAYQKPGVHFDRSASVGAFADLLLLNLDLAVDWFFVLSGFLLFLPFARAALVQQGQLSSRDFLRRRMYRIVPAYYVVLLVFWSLGQHNWPSGWSDLLKHLTFTHIFDLNHMFTTVGPAWSLADEVIYYLFLAILGPFCYWLCGMFGTPQARTLVLTGLVLLLVGVSLTYHAHFLWRGDLSLASFPAHFQPLARFNTFGLGMLLAVGVVATGGPKLHGRVPTLLRLLGVLLLLLTLLLPGLGKAGAIAFPTFSGLSFLLILCSTVLAARTSLWIRALGSPPLRFLGLISYGMYLWHEPVLIALLAHHWVIHTTPNAIFGNIVLTVVIAVAFGSLSYWAVERPMIRRSQHRLASTAALTRDNHEKRWLMRAPSSE